MNPVNVTPILPTDSIGDSLSAVNLNFSNIDCAVTELEDIVGTFKEEYETFYDSYYEDLSNLNVKLSSRISDLDRISTLVQENSARWIQPISLVYPKIIVQDAFRLTSLLRAEIQSWINTELPVITTTGVTSYIAKQLAYISIFFKRIVESATGADTTVDDNIQTIVFRVEDGLWVYDSYLVGSRFAPLPTPAPTLTPTNTPTHTPSNTPYTTPTPTNTCTPTNTLTPSSLDWFVISLESSVADQNYKPQTTKERCGYGNFFKKVIGRSNCITDTIPAVFTGNQGTGSLTFGFNCLIPGASVTYSLTFDSSTQYGTYWQTSWGRTPTSAPTEPVRAPVITPPYPVEYPPTTLAPLRAGAYDLTVTITAAAFVPSKKIRAKVLIGYGTQPNLIIITQGSILGPLNRGDLVYSA